jgi:hypothetical protein
VPRGFHLITYRNAQLFYSLPKHSWVGRIKGELKMTA